MGALTSHAKRDNPSNPRFDSFSHVSKKPRFSFSQPKNPSETLLLLGSSNSTVSRVSRYPEPTSHRKWKREVHAPCRAVKFGLNSSKEGAFSGEGGDKNDRMGIYLSRKLELAKKNAVGAIRYLVTDEDVVEVVNVGDDDVVEVVNVGNEDNGFKKQPGKGRGSEDSGVEVVEDDGGMSGGVREQCVHDGNDEVKVVEERSVVTIGGDGSMAALVENDGKGLGPLGLRGGEGGAVDVADVEVYKRLLEDMERNSGRRLRELDFEIEVNLRKLNDLRLLWPPKEPKKEAVAAVVKPAEPFVALTKEEEADVKRAFLANNRKKVLVSHANTNIDITGEALQCLRPGAWLNDEVINVYLELLKEREKRKPQKFLNCHFFNTFFYKKLTSGGYNYRAVKRWTSEKKLGYFLIDCDMIFVPVHREIHWCLAIINKKDHKFQYLDSLRGRDFAVLENLAKYYVEEVKDKSRKDVDVSDWEREFVEDLPEQQNGYDCGVFMIKYADFYSRDLGLCFTQENMPYFRLRTAKEILRRRAD